MLDLDLNKLPNEEDDDNAVDELLDETLDDEPFIGQTFSTFEEAYIFYKNYARQHGFAVRKDRSDVRNNQVQRRDIICHRVGKKPLKVIDPSKDQRNRESQKCECNAHIRVTWKQCFDIFPEEWHVTTFIKDHNHDLLSPEEMPFLPMNRIITPEDEYRILIYKEAGLNVCQIIRVMELQKQVKHGELSFFDKDIRNQLAKKIKLIGASDAMSLIDYMKYSKQNNAKFQYVYTVDNERRLENLFWCHPQSFEWYSKYGDVVVFDTTYKVNRYDMPCGLFVGINNHGKTVRFGCALLRNEKTCTFKWLMNTFVTIMKKSPKTIITDQDPWMSEEIASEMPTTKHSYCIWHITTKFSSWFTALLRTKYQSWCADFYMLYRMNSVEDFEHNWPLIVGKYNLENNNHVVGLYKIRSSWAPTYLHEYFYGGMTTTSRSESINAFIKRFVSSHTCLKDFVKHLDLSVDEIRQGESQDKMLATLRPVSLKAKSPLVEQAFNILTPFAFTKFQEEFQRVSQYLVVHFKGGEFIIRHFDSRNGKNHNVFWDGTTTMCSCKNFEFWGIVRRHIFRVLIHNDCFKIPDAYMPLRWCRNTFHSNTVCEDTSFTETLMNDETNLLDDIAEDDDVLCPPKSSTKGRKRKGREKSGKELANKKRNRCSLCKELGHTRPTCPDKENINVMEVGSSSSDVSRKKLSPKDFRLNPIFVVKY